MGFGLKVVEVVGQASHVQQAINWQFHELAEQAELFHAREYGMEEFTNLGLQMGQKLDLDQLPFRRFGPLLGPGAMLGQHAEFVGIGLGGPALDQAHQLPVNLQVWVAANRGCEVAVIL